MKLLRTTKYCCHVFCGVFIYFYFYFYVTYIFVFILLIYVIELFLFCIVVLNVTSDQRFSSRRQLSDSCHLPLSFLFTTLYELVFLIASSDRRFSCYLCHSVLSFCATKCSHCDFLCLLYRSPGRPIRFFVIPRPSHRSSRVLRCDRYPPWRRKGWIHQKVTLMTMAVATALHMLLAVAWQQVRAGFP